MCIAACSSGFIVVYLYRYLSTVMFDSLLEQCSRHNSVYNVRPLKELPRGLYGNWGIMCGIRVSPEAVES